MPLTALQRIRLNVRDPYVEFSESQLGDGSAVHFRLSSYPVLDASAQVYVGGTLKTETTDYTLDDATGKLTFVAAPGNGVTVFVRGQASLFSDTELNDILAQHDSDLTTSTLHVLRLLIGNKALQDRWKGGNVEVDPADAQKALTALYTLWKEDEQQAAIDAGGVEEWATSQADY